MLSRQRIWRVVLVVATSLTLLEGPALAEVPDRSITTGGDLLVVRSATGKDLWTKRAADGHLVQLSGVGKDLVVAVDSNCTDETAPEGSLVAFEAGSGRVRWRKDSPIGVATKSMYWMRSPSADVAADGVVVSGGGRFGPGVTGLSARTGKQVWALSDDVKELGVSEHLIFSAQPVQGERLVLSVHSRRTGEPLWTFPTTLTDAWSNTFDVVAADQEYVIVGNGGYLSRSGNDPGAPTTFSVLKAQSGAVQGSFTVADPSFQFSDFVLAHGVFVYSERTSVTARSLPDGAKLWTRVFDEAVPFSNVSGVAVRTAGGGNRVLVEVRGAEGHDVTALDLVHGVGRWTIHDVAVGSADARNTVIWQRSDPQVLTGVDTRSGAALWHRKVPRAVAEKYGEVNTGVASGRVAMAEVCDLG